METEIRIFIINKKTTMNKTELTNNVAATSGLSQKDAALVVNAVLHVITTTMQQGDEVVIPGFGSFKVKDRPARTGRNPRTGESIKIAAKKVVKFTPGTGLEIVGKPARKAKKK